MKGEDSFFNEMMDQLGVRPMDDKSQSSQKGPKATCMEDDEALFLAAVESDDLKPAQESRWATSPPEDPERREFIDALAQMEVIPHKDELFEPAEEKGARKTRISKKDKVVWDDCLDLHGNTAAEAVDLLARFVATSFARSKATVVVITGKGKHSKSGVSVIKPAVENWILRHGKRFIRSYAEAPRAYGGKGAFLLYLRSS